MYDYTFFSHFLKLYFFILKNVRLSSYFFQYFFSLFFLYIRITEIMQEKENIYENIFYILICFYMTDNWIKTCLIIFSYLFVEHS